MVDPSAGQVHPRQDPIGDVSELKAVGIDQQQLLLQPQRERLAVAERRSVRLSRPQGATSSAARAAMRPNTSAAASPLA